MQATLAPPVKVGKANVPNAGTVLVACPAIRQKAVVPLDTDRWVPTSGCVEKMLVLTTPMLPESTTTYRRLAVPVFVMFHVSAVGTWDGSDSLSRWIVPERTAAVVGVPGTRMPVR